VCQKKRPIALEISTAAAAATSSSDWPLEAFQLASTAPSGGAIFNHSPFPTPANVMKRTNDVALPILAIGQ